MKLRLKSAVAATSVAAIVGGSIFAFAGAAFASVPYEPDPNAGGVAVFYNSSGNVITGGTDWHNLGIAYAAASTPSIGPAGTKATLYFAAPDHTQSDSNAWFTKKESGSITYPLSSAPSPISGTAATNANGTAFANPVVSLGSSDANVAAFAGAATLDTSTGYNGVIQARITTGGADPKFWSADITVADPTTLSGGSSTNYAWSVSYPGISTTTTTLTTTPANGGNTPASGSGTSLSATVAGLASGQSGVVEFFDNGALLGSPHAVSAASATATATATGAANATHAYSAQFFPDGGVPATQSTSATSSVTYTNDAIATTTSAAAPTTAAQYSPVNLTATITEADAPTTNGLTGTVTFFDGGTQIGQSTSPTINGTTNAVYSFTATFSSQGTHQITASYAPTIGSYSAAHPTFYASSADNTNHTVTVSAPACGHGGTPGGDGTTYSGIDCQQDNNVDAIVDVGSLTLTTPYTTALGNTFHFGHLKLDPTGSFFTSGNLSFPAAADAPIIVHSSLASNPNWTLSVSATDLKCQVGAAPGNCSATDKISGAGLGLTAGQVVTSGTTPDNTKLYGASANGAAGPTLHPGLAYPILPTTELVAFTDIPAHQPVAGDTNHGLLAGASPWTFAQTVTDSTHTGGNGSVAIRGTIVLDAPSNTNAGLYAGTITFLVN